MDSRTSVIPSDTVGQLAWWIDRAERLRLENEALRATVETAVEWLEKPWDHSLTIAALKELVSGA